MYSAGLILSPRKPILFPMARPTLDFSAADTAFIQECVDSGNFADADDVLAKSERLIGILQNPHNESVIQLREAVLESDPDSDDEEERAFALNVVPHIRSLLRFAGELQEGLLEGSGATPLAALRVYQAMETAKEKHLISLIEESDREYEEGNYVTLSSREEIEAFTEEILRRVLEEDAHAKAAT
jgi:hypothetical protein